MKKLRTLLGIALGAAFTWWAQDKATIAPDIFFAGAVTGLLAGVLAGIPVGLLVLAAARRDEDRAGRRQQTGQQATAYPPQRPGQAPVYLVQAPHQPQAPGYLAAPPPGSWQTASPAAYDLDWPGNPPIIDR